MELEFWKDRWINGQIGFHQDRVNPYLAYFYGQKGPSPEKRNALKVFVPLCGKSRDMLWLAQNGYQVLGVECSELAVKAFFDETGLAYRHAAVEDSALYQFMPDDDSDMAAIEILQGDFFAMQPDDLKGVTDIFDRASLIALPESMREDYAQKMATLVASGTRVLLVTLTYDQSEMNGPPFSVSEQHVHALYDDAFAVEKLCFKDIIEDDVGMKERGLTSLIETVYKLTKR